MRTLIIGEGKSGTTALLRSVSAAMNEPQEIFEPDDLSQCDLAPENLVAKKLLGSWGASEIDSLDRFDRVVFIVRDPRDRLISHLLYDAYNRADRLDERQRNRWLGALERKSADPPHLPLIRMMDIWWQLTKANLLHVYMRSMQRTNEFGRQHGDRVHVMRYEDLVDGEFDQLSAYLGLPVEAAEVREAEHRVKRAGRHGDWREWFTPVDVNVFRPISSKWLRRHGYAHRDWSLSETPSIDPASTVDYVRRLFDLRPPES